MYEDTYFVDELRDIHTGYSDYELTNSAVVRINYRLAKMIVYEEDFTCLFYYGNVNVNKTNIGLKVDPLYKHVYAKKALMLFEHYANELTKSWNRLSGYSRGSQRYYKTLSYCYYVIKTLGNILYDLVATNHEDYSYVIGETNDIAERCIDVEALMGLIAGGVIFPASWKVIEKFRYVTDLKLLTEN